MKHCIGKLAVFVAVVLLGGVGANAVQAQEYGSVVLRNPTSATIHYEFKWGDGSWTSRSLAPHSKRYHYHELDVNGRAPAPYVHFNWVAGTDAFKTHHLGFYSVCNPWNGKPYHFRYSSCGCHIYLYAD